MATPILIKNGSLSGPSVASQGSNDLVIGETVTISDLEGANGGATRLTEFDDVPVGSALTVLTDATTDNPTFVPDVTGSYRIKMTINGVESSIEVFAVPLANTASRIPSYKEQLQYDGGGNAKGWHEAQTFFMRMVDLLIGGVKSSSSERQAAVGVPIGASSQEVSLGTVLYPGSVLAIGINIENTLTAGNLTATVKKNGSPLFSTQINTISPNYAIQVELPGTHVVGAGDKLTAEIVGVGYTNGGPVTSTMSMTLAVSNTLDTGPISIPDASNTLKGASKLSVAAAVANQPVAVGSNDPRVPTQNENDALQGTAGVSSNVNRFVTDQDSRNTDSRAPTTHTLGGAAHSSDTLANLNAKISDATLDDVSATRPPTAHALGGAAHSSDTLANLNAKISDATLIDTADTRIPTQDENNALVGTNGAPATGNPYVTNTDPRNTDARAPTAHAIGSSAHSADTFANLKTKVSDETLAGLGTVQSYTKSQHSAVVTLTDAANVVIDAADSNIFKLTATGGVGATRQLNNPSNLVVGMTWQVWFVQDVSGGRALTFGSAYDWGDEGAPSFGAQGSNIKNIITCVAIGASQIAATALKGFA